MKLNAPIHCAVLSLALALAANAASQPCQVYSEDFETDHSSDGSWVVHSRGGFNPVNLHFDYSSVGIPAAPNSAGGSTFGLKLQANLNPLVQQFPSGSSASPAGFSVPEHFEMRWDWWINYNNGNGSTQVGGGGFGTAGTIAQLPSTVSGFVDCIFVAATGDGGSAFDYRVYTPKAFISLQDGDPVYVNVVNRNNTQPYYTANFPAQPVPPAQSSLYPSQIGAVAPAGVQAFKWHQVSLTKIADILTWQIDGVVIGVTDVRTNGALGGGKLMFNHFDINNLASLDPNAAALAFSLVDNVRVTDLCCLVDSELPTINCPPEVCVASDAGNCIATGVALGTPVTSDNCSVASVVNDAPAQFPLGVTPVRWTVTDAAGNMATCLQNVTVLSSVSITWLPPLAGQPVANKIRVGQVVPHKVELKDCAGAAPSGATVRLKVQGVQATGLGEVVFQDVVEDANGTGLDGFMANDGLMVPRGGHYQFNLDTSNFSDPNTFGESDKNYRSTVIVVDDATGCELGRSSVILETRR